ncbi:hypothetical protein ACQUFG_17200, partial [Enterococcus gallinarum]|uniref:hypothetical protein n=1 Tax=Enterococcus gallinarum TaxID=1353 RepID=UPI003D0E159D
RALLKKASGIAVGRFGMRGIPSNPLLLHEILSFYVANANGRKEPEKQRTEEPKVSALEL